MKYISLFSGIGGLESKDSSPIILCEKDEYCIKFLQNKYKNVEIVNDVKKLLNKKIKLPKVDIVSGGWPCQDISVAGEKKGFDGENSVLFYDLLAVAKKSKSETIIAENVPNLLYLNQGKLFKEVLFELHDNGFKNIAWRIINSRSFNLPHQRRRLFIVASKNQQVALNLFNQIRTKIKKPKIDKIVNGFYHTAGTHSICFSKNYVPTIKVSGAAPSIQYDNVIRRLTPKEAVSLQGFNIKDFKEISDTQIFSMAGNAVSKPVGNFIFSTIENNSISLSDLREETIESGMEVTTGDLFDNTESSTINNGYFINGNLRKVQIKDNELCENLADYIDFNENTFLSTKAVIGLLRRAIKAKKPIDKGLLKVMLSNDNVKEAFRKEDISNLSISKKGNNKNVDAQEELSFY